MKYRHFVTGKTLKQGVFFCSYEDHVIRYGAPYAFNKTGKMLVADCGKSEKQLKGGGLAAKTKETTMRTESG